MKNVYIQCFIIKCKLINLFLSIPFIEKILPSKFIGSLILKNYMRAIQIALACLNQERTYWNEKELNEASESFNDRIEEKNNAKNFDDYVKVMDKMDSAHRIVSYNLKHKFNMNKKY